MPYYNKKTDKMGKALEKIEHDANAKLGTTNIIDIGIRAGFKYNLKDFKKKKV